MNLAVLLGFTDGSKQFVDDAHVHGISNSKLLLASGAPGAGMDAAVVREVPLSQLDFVETCQRDTETHNDGKSDFGMSWPDGEQRVLD